MNTDDLQNVFAATAEATRIERTRCLEAIASVPELPGEMPDALWNKIRGDRDAMAEALRIAVRKTKEEAASYVLRNEKYARGRFFYQTDEARVAACNVYEVRAKPANTKV